jgi:AraC family transcriptional regulator of adaptative response/methylated-DNA-[protein]-cysteine methyltransferase
VTDAIYEAGYSGPGRFYADAKARLGMTPTAWRDGGRGETIRWATAETDASARCWWRRRSGASAGCRSTRARRSCGRASQCGDRAGRRGDGRAGGARGGGGERAGAAARSAARRARHRLSAGGVARAQPHPAGRVAELCGAGRAGGQAGRGAGGGHGCGANQIAVLIPCHRARAATDRPAASPMAWSARRRCWSARAGKKGKSVWVPLLAIAAVAAGRRRRSGPRLLLRGRRAGLP